MSTISDSVNRKFIDSINLQDLDLDIQIETDTGWVPVSAFNLTVPYDVWRLVLEDGRTLECADTHIIFDSKMREVFVKNLQAGTTIMTQTGLATVQSVNKLDRDPELMMDITVDSDNHRYYDAQGLLHHNTTSVAAFIVWSILFKPSYAIGIMANKMPMAQGIIERAELAYENLPKWLQQGVITWNKRSLELENHSSVFAAPTTPSGLRSKSLSLILLDEFAHVPRGIQSAFFTSTYPVITSGTETKVIMISTPNGIEMFSKTWLDANDKKNDYVPVKVNWWDTPGRDEAWKEETIRNTSKEQFRVEFECQIVGSTNTLIDPNTLTTLRAKDPIRESEGIRVYEDVQRGHTYMLVADTARGVEGDFSAFAVMDVTSMPYKVAATYRDNTIKPVEYPNYIAHAAKIYNEAYVLPETNDIGGQIVDMLIDELECANVMSTGTHGRAGVVLEGEKNVVNGIRTTAGVKRIGCFNLKMLVENQKLLIESDEIISELCSFVSQGKSFSAELGTHDDLVMCLVLFSWASSQDAFKTLAGTVTESLDNMSEENKGRVEEEKLTFGVIIDEGDLEEEKKIKGLRAYDFVPALSDLMADAIVDNGRW